MKSLLTIALSLLVLTGCTDDDNDDNDIINCLPPAISSLSFSYTGDITGTYSVQGELPSSTNTSQTIYDYNWAMGGTFEEFGIKWVLIHSNLLYNSQNNNRTSLIAQMHVPDKGIGKYRLPSRGLEFITLEYSPSWNGELLFAFVSGEVNVKYYQCNRMMGTFSGELIGLNDGNNVTINVTDGKFDVKLRPN